MPNCVWWVSLSADHEGRVESVMNGKDVKILIKYVNVCTVPPYPPARKSGSKWKCMHRNKMNESVQIEKLIWCKKEGKIMIAHLTVCCVLHTSRRGKEGKVGKSVIFNGKKRQKETAVLWNAASYWTQPQRISYLCKRFPGTCKINYA